MRLQPEVLTMEREHMERKIVIPFVIEQVSAALGDAGFEVSDGNVAQIVEYVNNGGEIVEDFHAAFRTLIADVATDLKIRKGSSAGQGQGKAMTPSRRELIKIGIAEYLCSDPSPWQAELIHKMTEGLDDDHLRKLDGMLPEIDEETDR
jgi:hypothetical protein